MRTIRLVIAAVALCSIALLSPTRATAADETVSPCCAKLCNPTTGTSVACKPAVLGGLGTNDLAGNVGLVRGCVDVETAPPGSVCYGGVILDSGAPTLFNGCLCVFGDSGSVSPGSGMCVRFELGTNLGEMLTPEACTALAIDQCGQNVVTTANDPACTTCPAAPTGCCVGSNSCTDSATADTCTGTGERLVVGHSCGQPECAFCGNGTCDAGENNDNCPADCPPAVSGCCQLNEFHCFACDDPRCAGVACVPNGTCTIESSGKPSCG